MTIELFREMERLLRVDLSSYPSEIFRDFFERLNWTSFDLAILHPEDIVFRARLNESDESFKLINDLSYKPASICKNWQRASSPGNTMFYGSFIPKDCTTEQYNNALLSTAFEIVPLKADNKTDGFLKKKITYSVWTVKKLDSLGVITTLEDMKSGKGTSNFSKARTYVNWPEPDKEKKINACLSFLKHYFTFRTENEYEYIPSAVFSEYLISKGYCGVYYPGIRTEFDTYNVAINPNSVNELLELNHAFEANLYINNEDFLIEPRLKAFPKEGNLKFDIPYNDMPSMSKIELEYQLKNFRNTKETTANNVYKK